MCSKAMRLVQFCRRGEEGVVRVGAEVGERQGVVDFKKFDSSLPSTMKEFLEMGEKGIERAQRSESTDPHPFDHFSRALSSGQFVVPWSEVNLLPPVTSPDKVVCVGMNYRDHCLEQNAPIPKEPIIFSKFPSAITGPFDDIILPDESQEVDWEVELAFVIGRKGKRIKASISPGAQLEEEALSYVAGFTVANDVSARDWQTHRNGKQWLLGKTFDSFCPLGPALVITTMLKDPHSLGIRCRVNGTVVQDSNTNQMIFNIEKLVAWVSKFVTLCPGDVFLTGTPPGVGLFRKPPIFLKKGDVVECEIDEIGVIRNTVV
ncbi:fumarylacetoacetate hydrolase domain-containing protein 2-like [Scleropages formosus]|uniref:Fumarylacetoacetate hydrolase domain-containing protein 2-like n=1 Tax=Scleropages formosus TaxID=113540 RepID=A0A0P7XUT6_SCLFO|nr:fumarylacetoacetate hydrolase domain-containing protein 2-like [Scleropages formosus]